MLVQTNPTVSLHQKQHHQQKKTIVGFVYISHCLLSFKGSCKSTRMEQKNKEHPDQFMHTYLYIYMCVYLYTYIIILANKKATIDRNKQMRILMLGQQKIIQVKMENNVMATIPNDSPFFVGGICLPVPVMAGLLFYPHHSLCFFLSLEYNYNPRLYVLASETQG
jgi:hypothetical protein